MICMLLLQTLIIKLNLSCCFPYLPTSVWLFKYWKVPKSMLSIKTIKYPHSYPDGIRAAFLWDFLSSSCITECFSQWTTWWIVKIKIIFDILIYKLPGEKTVHMLLNAKSTILPNLWKPPSMHKRFPNGTETWGSCSKHRMAEDKTFKIQGQQPGSHPLWLSPPSPGVFILSSQPPGERASWEVTRYGCTRPAACGTSPFMAGTLVHTQNWGIGLYAQTSKFLYWNKFLIPLVHELLEVVSYSTISATGCL